MRSLRAGMPALVRSVAIVAVLLAIGGIRTDGRWRADEEVRALWVTRATLSSPAAIAQMVRAAHSGGFNTLVVQVRGRGDAYYRSALEPRAAELSGRPEFDPLADVLALTRPAGLKVHAWINANLVSSAADLPTSRQHIIYRSPEWLMVPRELAGEMQAIDPKSPEYVGRLARWTRTRLTEVEGLYASPVHPGAAAHVANIAADIVSRYAVDGVHVDYARFPNADFDYSPATLQQFKHSLRAQTTDDERRRADAYEALNPVAYTTIFPERWRAFRQSRTTALIMRIRSAIKKVNPDVVLSAAVAPDIATAADSRMQDWRTWLDQGLIDVLCPMAYTQDSPTFARQIATARQLAGDRPVWAGVGAYRLRPAATIRHIDIARRSRAAGVILFSYEALVTPPNSAASLTDLGRAAFSTGSH